MTSITFYSHTNDRFHIAIKVCQKAIQKKIKVSILTTSKSESKTMSDLLWSMPAPNFFPNCTSNSPIIELTPIMIGHEQISIRQSGILINLTNEIPKCFSTFERLIEIVDKKKEVQISARKKFKFYKDRGYFIKNYQMDIKPEKQ